MAAAFYESEWRITGCKSALRTVNPIRRIVDHLHIPDKSKLIPLSIGDPTVFGNLKPPDAVNNAVERVLKAGKSNGYLPSTGSVAARTAIAARFSCAPHGSSNSPISAEDVVIASGCSGALEMCLKVLAKEGDNVLLPKPGFSLYETICGHIGVECRFYDLLPSRSWECDLQQMEKQITPKTRAILVNNPSNPCGSVFSEEHLRLILAVAERNKLPIISDEIYETITFQGVPFSPMASLSTEVPILTVGGLAKQFLVPGWRVGWIMIHDRKDRFVSVRDGLARLATLILGANSLVQEAIPEIFEETPDSFYSGLNSTLETNASICVRALKEAKGLKVVEPQGAMYMMVEILFDQFDGISTDLEFCQKLLDDEFVFVLPGSCFRAEKFFRIVLCPPEDKLITACERIKKFCESHTK
eukprot:933676_1